MKDTDDPLLLDGDGESIFKDCETATDVAKVIETLQGTSGANESAGALDAVATIISENISDTEAATITGTDPYTASGIPDGYYIILDVTTDLTAEDGTGSDTLAKHMLQIVTDTAITAKDTGITPIPAASIPSSSTGIIRLPSRSKYARSGTMQTIRTASARTASRSTFMKDRR